MIRSFYIPESMQQVGLNDRQMKAEGGIWRTLVSAGPGRGSNGQISDYKKLQPQPARFQVLVMIWMIAFSF